MIGVFDSGFGGLHVLRGITKRLPQYDYVYLGDSAHAPYGSRPSDEVYTFTKWGVEFLFARGATLVVLACNTASSEALRRIQTDYHGNEERKVLGVLIPFAEAAAAQTRTKRVGVLATEGTVRSGSFVREIQKSDPSIEVFQQACPLLVPLVEAGEQDSPAADVLIAEYIAPVVVQKVDTVVLGCTHYGILEEKIRAAAGPSVRIISEQNVIPEKLEKYFEQHPDIEARLKKSHVRSFYTTGPVDQFERLGSIFFGSAIQAEAAL